MGCSGWIAPGDGAVRRGEAVDVAAVLQLFEELVFHQVPGLRESSADDVEWQIERVDEGGEADA